MTTKQRNFPQLLWDFFCSLKLTIFLLIFLAIISIIGTVIPQGTPPAEYLAEISPAKLKLYKSLGFFDMYHSWWFILMLYLLTLNLISCSIKRLPHIWKTVTQPVTVMSGSLEQSLSNRTSFKVADDADAIKEKAIAFLKADFAEPVVTEEGGAWHLFAQKNPWCRLSVYFVHLSVIVIFIGAIIGSLFGYKGYVNILEGDSINKVVTRSEKEIDLGFSVACQKFSLTRYPNGAPKEFKSILTVLENGVPVPGYEHYPIIVNHPLTYKGITFYQSSYGDASNYHFNITDQSGKNSVNLTANNNSSLTLPDGSSMHVLEAVPDVSPYAPGLSGPAVQIEVHSPSGATERLISYANHPELNVQNAKQQNSALVFNYKGAEERMYTGLQVAKDPGVWVVWLGCLLMIVGIYAAFFMSHRRIWVRIQNGTVTVGGNASKNPGAFQQYFTALTDKFASHLSKEKNQ